MLGFVSGVVRILHFAHRLFFECEVRGQPGMQPAQAIGDTGRVAMLRTGLAQIVNALK